MRWGAFYWIVNMSICGAVVGGVVFLIGKISRIPRKVQCILWGIPFLRMWIPFGIQNPYSLMTLIAGFTAKSVTVVNDTIPVSAMNFVMQAESYFPIQYKTPELAWVFRVAGILWAVLAAALLLALLLCYGATKAELRDACHIGDNMYLSEKILSPAVYGIFRPRILIPTAWAQKDLKYVQMHENSHIRRKDNLWRTLAVTTACVHWFNPFSWVFLKTFLETLELACDEAVLDRCEQEESKAYAAALLDCAESKHIYASAFGGASVRIRIEKILSYKKLSVFSMCVFGILVLAVGYVLLTNAG